MSNYRPTHEAPMDSNSVWAFFREEGNSKMAQKRKQVPNMQQSG